MPRHEFWNQRSEHRPAHRQADAVGKGQRQQQWRRDQIEKYCYAQHCCGAGQPELRHYEVAAAVQNVGQRPARQAEQKNRQGSGGLYQGNPNG